MRVIIADHALAVIDLAAAFVESQNTPGSGNRYALRFKKAIKDLAIRDVQYPICNHPHFAKLQYSCSHFNSWVIAFRIENDKLIVHEIVLASLLI
ncbi:hypothetical protein EOD41_14495 [Mucilaginibacter limnophilus]|uniref:Type II toxin-antitoxin system RelE/ParE family toxin n=1 Tax=Mucilaginibacter limnophilus TaxID=1932778 RepID=A0A3S2WXA7_9SPHI|nr:hypothetical protein [Mucilaginibacter limnophilus]RVU00166.1 hypothetical protein EOD41_14495 [Mucilaginibacter limnophilus]